MFMQTDRKINLIKKEMNPFTRLANYEELNIIGTGRSEVHHFK